MMDGCTARSSSVTCPSRQELAPTAINQQKFEIALKEDGTVEVIDKGGIFSKVDKGIVTYQFEVGARA